LITPNSATGIKGTVTNDSAQAGSIGEYVTASASSVSLPIAGTTTNIASISLTAGDWDVSGVGQAANSASTLNNFTTGISTTSATLGAIGTYAQMAFPGGVNGITFVLPTPNVRLSLSSTTTVFLVIGAIAGSGTGTGAGVIRARRIR
jgi:hypothetical protein